MSMPPPPINTPVYTKGGAMAGVWVQWYQRLYADLGGASSVIPVTRGGIGIASGISGGILGFTGITTLASSPLLSQNRLVMGGGAGATPSTPLALGTASQVLHGNVAGAPSWGAVDLTVDVTGTLPAANGGTGNNAYTVGDLLYASGATALAKLSDVATGNALTSGGVGAAPSWGKVGLTTHVSGTLPVANGGTGITSGTSGGVLGFTAAGTIASSAALTANALVLGGGAGATPSTPVGLGTTVTVLHGNAGGAPSWGAVSLTADVSGLLPLANGGTNANLSATGGASQVLKQTSVGGAVTVAQLAASDLSNGTTGSGAVMLTASPTTTGTLTAGVANFTKATAGDTVSFTNGGASNKTMYIYTDSTYVMVSAGAGATADLIAIDVTNHNVGIYAGASHLESARFAKNNVYMPGSGTTASAANAFLDSGSTPANELLRSTSSLRYKPFVRPLELDEARKLVLEAVPVAYMHESGQQGVGLVAEWEARDPRMVTRDRWGRPDWVQYPHYVAPLMLLAQDHERRMKAAGI